MVYLRRMVFGILLLVGLLVGGIVAACYAGRKLADDDYNCLNLSNQLQVQLNTHLEPVPEIVHSISPDGNYQIVSVFRSQESRRLFLENTHTHERIKLQNTIWKMYDVLWSNTGNYVAYSWWVSPTEVYRTTIATVHGEQFSDMRTYSIWDFEFSPHDEYLAVNPHPKSLQFYALPNLSLVPISLLDAGEKHAWAPTDHVLIYIANSQLLSAGDPPISLINLQTGTRSAIPLPEGIGEDQSSFIEFSPDAHYVALAYETDEQDLLQIWSVGEETPILVGSVIDNDLANQIPARPMWLPDSPRFTYTRLSDNYPFSELWQFDIKTQQHEMILGNLRSTAYADGKLATLQLVNDMLILEIRENDGSAPQFVKAFQENEINDCAWFDHPTRGFIVSCSLRFHGGSANSQWITPSGEVIWFDDFSSSINPDSWWYFDPLNERFRLSFTQLDDKTKVELHDYQGDRVYEFPETMLEVLLNGWSGQFPPRDNISCCRDFRVMPSPDETIWFVHFERMTFRIDPARNFWEFIETEHPISNIMWSPDGKRYVFATYDAYTTLGDLYVYESDQSRYWNLGMFPGNLLREMTWTHCGDSLAPLRDHLAAESLD